MDFINLTPHEIVFHLPDGGQVRFAPSGHVARVEQLFRDGERAQGLPTVRADNGRLNLDLQELFPGFAGHFIVSGMVLDSISMWAPSGFTQSQFVAPATNHKEVRNEKGHVVAVTSWLRV